jgi:hypothetical protein
MRAHAAVFDVVVLLDRAVQLTEGSGEETWREAGEVVNEKLDAVLDARRRTRDRQRDGDEKCTESDQGVYGSSQPATAKRTTRGGIALRLALNP